VRLSHGKAERLVGIWALAGRSERLTSKGSVFHISPFPLGWLRSASPFLALMKIYIAGKISGLVYEDALQAFVDAESVVQALGYEPVNPMRENGLDGDGNVYAWSEYMKRDIPHLLRCDGIYLLSNWQDSKGARLEKHIAQELGMLVIHENAVEQVII
jgi:hypothetical protein